MKHRQIIQTVNQTISTVEGAGGKVPKPAKEAFAKFPDLAKRASRLVDMGANLAEVVVDALEADRDPGTDPAVQAAVAHRALTATALDNELDRRAALLIDTHAPSLFEALRTPFEAGAAVLVRAYEELGDVDLDDTAAVLSRGGNAARAWADAQEADALIERVHQSCGALGLAAHSVRFEAGWRLLNIADVPPGVMLDENLRGTSIRPWDVLRRGWPLSFATPESMSERVAAVLEEQRLRSVQHEGDFEQGYRRMHGTGTRAVASS